MDWTIVKIGGELEPNGRGEDHPSLRQTVTKTTASLDPETTPSETPPTAAQPAPPKDNKQEATKKEDTTSSTEPSVEGNATTATPNEVSAPGNLEKSELLSTSTEPSQQQQTVSVQPIQPQLHQQYQPPTQQFQPSYYQQTYTAQQYAQQNAKFPHLFPQAHPKRVTPTTTTTTTSSHLTTSSTLKTSNKSNKTSKQKSGRMNYYYGQQLQPMYYPQQQPVVQQPMVDQQAMMVPSAPVQLQQIPIVPPIQPVQATPVVQQEVGRSLELNDATANTTTSNPNLNTSGTKSTPYEEKWSKKAEKYTLSSGKQEVETADVDWKNPIESETTEVQQTSQTQQVTPAAQQQAQPQAQAPQAQQQVATYTSTVTTVSAPTAATAGYGNNYYYPQQYPQYYYQQQQQQAAQLQAAQVQAQQVAVAQAQVQAVQAQAAQAAQVSPASPQVQPAQAQQAVVATPQQIQAQAQVQVQNQQPQGQIPLPQAQHPVATPNTPSARVSGTALLKQLEESDCVIPFEDLKIEKELARGSFGIVYRGLFRGTEVAVKKLLVQNLNSRQFDDFIREIMLMRRLRHPNVLLYMGVCTVMPNLCVITEYMSRGSLWDVLHNYSITMDWRIILKIALDSAKGMAYLHGDKPPIIHRDLKSANILVDQAFTAKIADFGLSKIKDLCNTMTGQTGTPGYMAPEIIQSLKYTEKVDVYSFGVILWELVTRQPPYSGIKPMQILFAVVQGSRPQIPYNCPAGLSQLMTNCWHHNPDRRPSFGEIILILKGLETTLVPRV